MSKLIKIIIISMSILFIILLAGLGYAGNYFYNLALNPKTPKDMVFKNLKKDEDTVEVNAQGGSSDKTWLLDSSEYKNQYIKTDDNFKLHAYEVSSKNNLNRWVIAVHGYTSDGSKMSNVAKHYYDMGYNILVPNLRGHGKSEGDYIGMGWDDRLDIIKWIKKIKNENNNAEIVLHGISMGASTVLMTSGEVLPSNVVSIIADCGYTNAWDQFSYHLKLLFNLPSFPAMDAANLVTKIRAGYDLKDVSATKQVAKSKTPILFIHGDKDDFVPYHMMEELYKSANSKKEKLVIEGALHGNSSTVNPKLYWSTVEAFINKYN